MLPASARLAAGVALAVIAAASFLVSFWQSFSKRRQSKQLEDLARRDRRDRPVSRNSETSSTGPVSELTLDRFEDMTLGTIQEDSVVISTTERRPHKGLDTRGTTLRTAAVPGPNAKRPVIGSKAQGQHPIAAESTEETPEVQPTEPVQEVPTVATEAPAPPPVAQAPVEATTAPEPPSTPSTPQTEMNEPQKGNTIILEFEPKKGEIQGVPYRFGRYLPDGELHHFDLIDNNNPRHGIKIGDPIEKAYPGLREGLEKMLDWENRRKQIEGERESRRQASENAAKAGYTLVVTLAALQALETAPPEFNIVPAEQLSRWVTYPEARGVQELQLHRASS